MKRSRIFLGISTCVLAMAALAAKHARRTPNVIGYAKSCDGQFCEEVLVNCVPWDVHSPFATICTAGSFICHNPVYTNEFCNGVLAYLYTNGAE